jgi:hypothetical protein
MAEKASPSERALRVLVEVKAFAPNATINYAAALNDAVCPEHGEHVWIPEGGCFPNAPGLAVCWPLPTPAKKTRAKRP